MSDWFIIDPATGKIESNFSEKFGEAARGVVDFFHNTADGMKKDTTVATTVSAMGGIAGFTLGFWGLKKFLFEKIGMDGMVGDIASLAGAVIIGLALFNVIAAKDADSRASYLRQQWAATHPQSGGAAPSKEILDREESAIKAADLPSAGKASAPSSSLDNTTRGRSVTPSGVGGVTVTVGEPEAGVPQPVSLPNDGQTLAARTPAPRPGSGFG